MNEKDDNKDFLKSDSEFTGGADNEKLRSLLRTWQAPDAPSALDTRVLAAYRRRNTLPTWRRMVTATIPVPAPVAMIFVVLLLASALLAARALRSGELKPDRTITSAAQTKTTEAPANQEKAPAFEVNSPGSVTETVRNDSSAPIAGRAAGSMDAGRSEVIPRVAKPASLKTVGKVHVLSIESDHGTIQLVTGDEYRLSATPKIYAGGYSKPSNERRLP